MSKKHLSLKEFYENHGTSRASYNSLPVRPRCDKDDDQALHLRLAQGCSLDSGKAHPQQRHGPVKEGPHAEYGSYGIYGSSRDGAAVGDVDYHRPHSNTPSSGRQHSSHYTRRHGSSGPGPNDRSGQYSYDPAGSYPQHRRGSVSPSGVPPVAGPPGAGGVGAPAYFGGTPAHPAGPGYDKPPPRSYGPLPGSYGGPPPQQPYGLPPGTCAPPGPMAAGCGEGPPPQLVPPMAAAGFAGGYGMPAGPYGMPPPPPPPPRHLPAQQHPAIGGASAQMPAMGSTPGADRSRHAATAQIVAAPVAAPPAAPQAAGRQAAPAAQPVGKTAEPAVGRRVTPFAAAEPAVEAPAEPPAPAGPKNEFAERLAQRAMASAARAKSSLLAGGGSGNLSRDGSLATNGSARASSFASALDIPAATASIDSNSSSPSEQQGVFARPSHPFSRSKLALKPRAAFDSPAHGSGNYSSTSSDSGDAAPDHGSGSAAGSTASSVGGGRPRLHLLPRGSGVSDSFAGTGAASSGAGARMASVFGDAKPREEVLKERGVDPTAVDAAVELGRKLSDGSTARQGSLADRASRLGTTHNSMGTEDDEWHTVSGHGRKVAAAQRDSRLLPEGDAFDPFFGTSGFTKASNQSSFVAVPPASAFSRDIMRDGYGSSRRCAVYGSPAGRGNGFGAGVTDDAEDDGAVFRRQLPTRQVPLAL